MRPTTSRRAHSAATSIALTMARADDDPCEITLRPLTPSSAAPPVTSGSYDAAMSSRPGITTFDASAGGLGGCPYAKSATGNLATEDLVWLLTGLGVEHGVDLERLVATSVWMARELGRPSPSAVVKALADSSA